MNRQAAKRHLSFYELICLLIDEQGSTETLIQQVTSGRVTANDLRLRITARTAEYDGGTRTMEQFLRAVAYDVPEPMNFWVPPFLPHYFVLSYYSYIHYIALHCIVLYCII
ncbi:hypothetical protein T03_15571 [Trichinella britovi]|uniref:Uncharacterized protein n=1 Tax=Trichinella britovi TaxID=45882 RepID=A0A0V1DB94_TRIBR|nr:hypothetical protein T03_15571 [Trichinella britovi]